MNQSLVMVAGFFCVSGYLGSFYNIFQIILDDIVKLIYNYRKIFVNIKCI